MPIRVKGINEQAAWNKFYPLESTIVDTFYLPFVQVTMRGLSINHQPTFSCPFALLNSPKPQATNRLNTRSSELFSTLFLKCLLRKNEMHQNKSNFSWFQNFIIVRRRGHVQYGNTGCGVFKRGVQNQKDFCLRINILKGNY